ncbi:MAG TPA: FG-GAP-like repeat-containing protein [Solirubrobacteraceae bacterium]|nr:FG-GAP-like repeat-containing protein [Solirubrobacteraceae bacterium]
MRTRPERRILPRAGLARLACALTLAATAALAAPPVAGALSFAESAAYPFGAGNSDATLATGDFNGDGIPDLAVATSTMTPGTGDLPATLTGGVQILLGPGDGTFETGSVIPIPDGAGTVLVGDFNADHHPDLVVADGSDGIVVLLGRGDGTFDPPGPPVTGSLMGVVGDFNGDGYDDVVASVYSTSGVQILFGGADGTLTPGPYVGGDSLLACPAAGDLNDDGKLDLLCTPEAPTDGTIDVLLGNGDGTFAPPIPTASGLPVSEGMAVGDVNADGHADVVVASTVPTIEHLGTQQISVLLGNGDGTLGRAMRLSMPDRQSFAFGPPSLADFDADGKLDILAPGWPAGVLTGNGDGSFQQPVDLGVYDANTAANAESSVVADFNGDGRPDIATLGDNEPTGGLQIYINGATSPLTVSPSAGLLGAQAIGAGSFSLIPIPTDKPVYSYSGPSQLVEVTNPGDGPVTLGQAAIAGADPEDFVIFNDFCSRATLAPGHACSLYVAFAPTATGPRTATVVIPDGAPDSPDLVPVSGQGQPGPPPTSTAASGAPAARRPPPCALGTRATLTARQVTVAVRCDRPVRATITGAVLTTSRAALTPRAAVAKAPKAVALKADRTVRLTVALDAGDRARLVRAAAHDLPLHLRLTLVVRGASGPQMTLTRVDAA